MLERLTKKRFAKEFIPLGVTPEDWVFMTNEIAGLLALIDQFNCRTHNIYGRKQIANFLINIYRDTILQAMDSETEEDFEYSMNNKDLSDSIIQNPLKPTSDDLN